MDDTFAKAAINLLHDGTYQLMIIYHNGQRMAIYLHPPKFECENPQSLKIMKILPHRDLLQEDAHTCAARPVSHKHFLGTWH